MAVPHLLNSFSKAQRKEMHAGDMKMTPSLLCLSLVKVSPLGSFQLGKCSPPVASETPLVLPLGPL